MTLIEKKKGLYNNVWELSKSYVIELMLAVPYVFKQIV